jgi:general secretion pathway protein K
MRGKSENGIALIAVLWTLTLLSIIAASLTLETRTSAHIARNSADKAAARAAADAGIQRAILDLLTSLIPPAASNKLDADVKAYDWLFANSRVHISIRDEGAKVDLNQAPEARFATLFASAGVDPAKAQSLADAIVDFRDADHLRRPSGAEDAEYKDAGLAWGPKNAPFETVEELQQVLGMTTQIYDRVAPSLTVYSTVEIDPATEAESPSDKSQPPVRMLGVVFSIRAEARGAGGATFVREAVVQLTPQALAPYQFVAWRRGGQTNARGAPL